VQKQKFHLHKINTNHLRLF